MKFEELKSKSLRKMWKRDKEKCLNLVEVSLPEVVDYFYNDIYKKSERDNRRKFRDIITAPITLKVLKKLVKKPSDGLPVEAIPFMLNGGLESAQFQMNKEIESIKASNQPKEQKDTSLKYVEERYSNLLEKSREVSSLCAKKYEKKLKKILPKDLASRLAIGLMPVNYVNERNIFFYLRLVFKSFYVVQEMGATETDGKVTSRARLEDPKVVGKILRETMLAKATPEIIAEVIIHGALDLKDKYYAKLTKAQKMAYDAITYYLLDLLNSKIFDKETIYRIIKNIARRRLNDKRGGGYDSERRIAFSKVATEYVDENGKPRFPRVVKAWEKFSKEK